MSESGESQRKLTLEDLDRFLDQAEPEPTIMPYFEAAAVLVAFDPFVLQPVPGSSHGQERETLLEHLLPRCEQIVDGPQRGLWSLFFLERRAALRRLATRERMRSALKANSHQLDTPVQRMFERVVDGDPLVLAKLFRDEIAALITVIDWTEGVLDSLPDRTAIRSALAKVDLLAPMQQLVGYGFVNRQDELEQLEQYVFGAKPLAPLFVFGPGGVGKSTLLARFILDHVEIREAPFAYIDIDRPTVRPDRPLTLLLEMVAQLHLQLDLPANITESLIKEITYGIGRQELGRAVESNVGGYDFFLGLFRNFMGNSPKTNDRVVILLDTFEEAQFLGPDVLEALLKFLFALKKNLPTFRVILSGRALPREFLKTAFPGLFDKTDELLIDDNLPLDRIPLPERPIDLGVLDEGSARELLQRSVQAAGLDPNELDDVIGIVGRNPMCLKLAARLLRDEGVKELREARSQFLVKLKAEKIQALLYGRILSHMHGDDLRKVAYPGLIVRRIAPDVIRDVLAKPCGIKLSAARNEDAIFLDLAKEAALVVRDSADGSLRHRGDVRRAMLEDLTDHIEPEVIEQIDRAAVAFYAEQPGDNARARAEEIYHRLRLREPAETLNHRWLHESAIHLKGAGEELPAQQRLWLAAKLGITLDESVRQMANQEAWEEQAARTADRFLQSGAAESALKVLSERLERLPRSRLFFLEAEAYRFLKRFEQAISVSRLGVESMSKAGEIDMVLDLLLKMAVIEETRGNLKQADKLLDEADAIAIHSRNEVLLLRVRITRLRLQRQLRPNDSEERRVLRRDALANLTDEMLRRLRSHPVLLREVAAELGEMDARIARTAIDTLGLEVPTDGLAETLGHAIETLNTAQASENAADPVLTKAVDQFKQKNFDPDVIKEWVTTGLTTTDIRILGQSLGGSESESEVLRDFQTYFRAAVDHTLRGHKQEPTGHGRGLRGANLSRNSPLFRGPFGRMFRALPPADFGDTDKESEDALNALAESMIAGAEDPKDGPDPEEGGIPSIYTYLGQFIDHDLTFDPASSLQKQNDPDALEDFRTPRFDLDNVYGRGPEDQPYFYADGRTFLQGKPLSGAAANPNARDMPRSWDEDPLARDISQRDRWKRRAIIGDPRNDENVIISQLQGIFHRFHNKVSADHPDWPFARVQREVRFHYQWVVLNDFLPTIVAEEVLNLVVPHVVKGTDVRSDRPVLEFFKWKNGAFMPLEFSIAAYRFGHSMVRPDYRLSETVPPLLIFATDPNMALTGSREFPDNWAIDWNLFSFLEPRDPDDATRTQLAYKIDTSLVNPLGNLPPSVAVNPNILALRNLLRGWRLRLPSGQDVARAMGIVPLKDAEIKIGKFTGDPADKLIPIVEVNPVFAGNCPLWTYILAETLETEVVVKTTKGDKKIKTRQLGHVGGRIVAETFVGLLLGDSSSYLSQNPLWTPDPKYQNAGCFGITELIRTALSRIPKLGL